MEMSASAIPDLQVVVVGINYQCFLLSVMS